MRSRRDFLKTLGLVTGGLTLSSNLEAFAMKKSWFEISLAQWSLHRTIAKGDLTNLDFPAFAKKEFGIQAVEYVNQFFGNKAQDFTYLKDLKARAKDHGVRNVLIMIDGEGQLGDENEANRKKAVDNHYKWIDAANYLGCAGIRVNAGGGGTPEEVKKRVIDSMLKLSEYAKKVNINVMIENHGGISSHGDWLASLLKQTNHKYAGSLPDFGNFYEYDRYQGVVDLMPYAKGVSAKTYDFDVSGLETKIDYSRMMKIVRESGYNGYIGVEYEGARWSEIEGIKATKALLERYR